jgi:hypothetical protein
MAKKPVKVWITKYALSQGIYSTDAEICTDISDKMISVKEKGSYYDQCFHKPDWYETMKEALEQAEKMKQRKIASLKKQVKKLESLKFEIK